MLLLSSFQVHATAAVCLQQFNRKERRPLVYFKVAKHINKVVVCYVTKGLRSTHLLQVFVTVDELALMRVLKFVGLDVLPQGLNDDRSGLGVDTQHTSQPGVQLELRGLFGKQKD